MIEEKTPPIQITLAAARVNAGLTQEDVAKAMHVSKNTIVAWEKGKTQPSIEQARKLSLLYKMTIDCIFFA